MKIWHVGAASNPYRVDGVSLTVWLLSRQQARLGHDVCLVVDTVPDDAALKLARETGIRLIAVDATFLNYAAEIRALIEREQPRIVHMHSVFIYRQATMARVLRQCGIPYVITPHGGLAPQVLRRGVMKKTLYAWLRERPRFMGAAAVALVTPAEERGVRGFIPDYRKPVRWMPNPVDTDKLDPHRWQGPEVPKRLVFLGRFDVLVKGIDVLIEIARLLPEMRFELYGTDDPKTSEWLQRLKQNLPGNVSFHFPIFGEEKAKMLVGASMYIQPSRWEGFPVSVAECMYLGVPSAVADTLDMAQLFFQHHLGLVIPLDPPMAAGQIRTALSDPNRMLEWSRRDRDYAMEHFHPSAVAQKHIRLYQDVASQNDREMARQGGEVGFVAVRSAQDSPAHRRSLVPAHVRGAVKQNVSRLIERSHRMLGSNGHPRTVVLCYHSIDNTPADLSVDPSVFRQQVVSLKDQGFEFLSFNELVLRVMRSGAPRKNVACITFDDGYEDNLTKAAPILLQMGIPATMFITTGLMSREPSVIDRFRQLTRYETNYLSPRQVEQLSRAGFEIGAHTHTHTNMAKLTNAETRDEVTRSKAMLEDATGARVKSFAYPFGKRNIHYTAQTVAVVRESEFQGAAAVAFRAVTARESIRIFEIPRFFVTRSDSTISFEQKVHGHFDWLGSIQEGTPRWLKAAVSPEDRY